jgi:hypothetical protein
MAKNAYLEKQAFERRFYLDVGVRMGRQQILDMFCLVLNDPKIMKKDTLGKKRLYKVILATGDCIDQYQDAWQKTDETDYMRAKLDEALAAIFGPELYESFEKRYEYSPEFDYKKGKWKR